MSTRSVAEKLLIKPNTTVWCRSPEDGAEPTALLPAPDPGAVSFAAIQEVQMRKIVAGLFVALSGASTNGAPEARERDALQHRRPLAHLCAGAQMSKVETRCCRRHGAPTRRTKA